MGTRQFSSWVLVSAKSPDKDRRLSLLIRLRKQHSVSNIGNPIPRSRDRCFLGSSPRRLEPTFLTETQVSVTLPILPRSVYASGRHVLSELATAVGVGRGTAIAEDQPGRGGVPTVEEPARWRQRYQDTLRRLRDAGVRLPAGLEAGWREYRTAVTAGSWSWLDSPCI